METEAHQSESTSHPAQFSATHWSVVLAASKWDSPEATAALDKLCRTYWYPLYAYVRRRGYGCEDAQDLTQEFLARFLAKNYLAGVDRSRRFRSYLLGAMNHFLADAWDHAHRRKRFAVRTDLPIDCLSAEALYQQEGVDELSPDRLFDHRWAFTLLEQALNRLHRRYEDAGENLLFQRLNGFLTYKAEPDDYAQIATELGMTQGAVRVAVFRMRERFKEFFRDEVAQTVSNPEELPGEMQHLKESLRR
jgi:RNA polymerase sigma factor (sigma-70 family)